MADGSDRSRRRAAVHRRGTARRPYDHVLTDGKRGDTTENEVDTGG
jgi:hypothetical protein